MPEKPSHKAVGASEYIVSYGGLMQIQRGAYGRTVVHHANASVMRGRQLARLQHWELSNARVTCGKQPLKRAKRVKLLAPFAGMCTYIYGQ